MDERQSDRALSFQKTAGVQPTTRRLGRRLGLYTGVVGLVGAGAAFASIFGMIVYAFLVADHIWTLAWPPWVALLVSLAAFAFLFNHVKKLLEHDLRKTRDGLGLAMISFGHSWVRAGWRLRFTSTRRATIAVTTIAFLIVAAGVIAAALYLHELKPSRTAERADPPRERQSDPTNHDPVFFPEPTPDPPINAPAPVQHASTTVPLPRPRSAQHHSHLQKSARISPLNIVPQIANVDPIQAYGSAPAPIHLCSEPFTRFMSSSDLNTCGLLPLNFPPQPPPAWNFGPH